MMQSTPGFLMGVVAGLLAAFLFAISVNVYKSQSEGIRPVAVSSIKMWISLPFMIVLELLLIPFRTTPYSVPLGALLPLSISMVAGAVVGDTAYLISQDRIGIAHAFPIAGAHPIMTYLVALAFLGEPFGIARMSGVILAVIGIVLITREHGAKTSELETKRSFDPLGIGLAFLALIMFSLAAIFAYLGVMSVDPVDANLPRVIVGSAALVPIYGVAKHKGMPTPSRHATKLSIVAGFLGMSVGSIFYIMSFKYVGAPVGSVLASTSPLFAVPMSLVFLKERVSRLAVVGITATITGVFLVLLGF
jgi:drug/metabolite transporter (DMT)-like permease